MKAANWRILGASICRSPGASEGGFDDVGGDGVHHLGGDDVTGSRDLLVRVAEQPRGQRDARYLLDESRYRAAVDVGRVLVRTDAERFQRGAVIANARRGYRQ